MKLRLINLNKFSNHEQFRPKLMAKPCAIPSNFQHSPDGIHLKEMWKWFEKAADLG